MVPPMMDTAIKGNASGRVNSHNATAAVTSQSVGTMPWLLIAWWESMRQAPIVRSAKGAGSVRGIDIEVALGDVPCRRCLEPAACGSDFGSTGERVFYAHKLLGSVTYKRRRMVICSGSATSMTAIPAPSGPAYAI